MIKLFDELLSIKKCQILFITIEVFFHSFYLFIYFKTIFIKGYSLGLKIVYRSHARKVLNKTLYSQTHVVANWFQVHCSGNIYFSFSFF